MLHSFSLAVTLTVLVASQAFDPTTCINHFHMPRPVKYPQTPLFQLLFPRSSAEYCAVSYFPSLPMISQLIQTKLQIPIVYLFIASAGSYRSLVGVLTTLCFKHSYLNMSFIFVDANSFSTYAAQYGLHVVPSTFPSLAIHNLTANTKFPLINEGGWDDSVAADFIQQFLKGRLKPTFVWAEPEPDPGEQGDKIVKKLVATTYQDNVHAEEKYVVVLISSPGCIHCVRVASSYAEYGKSRHRIVFAEIHTGLNDVPNFSGGIPCVNMYRGTDTGNVVIFTGQKNYDGLRGFVELHRRKAGK
ncbi:hypothetical protein IFR05_008026 [Cadophora sp. M221]|nr:hypothetical protein IFR05_008026 [Cadophora sp. M221]